MNFGRVLKATREAGGLSLRDAAKLIGISAPALCKIERGRPVDPDTMFTVCFWLMRHGSKKAA